MAGPLEREDAVRLETLSTVAADVSDRRRYVRYPCIARVRAGARRGVAFDMSSLGLAFFTNNLFAPNETVELCVNYDATRDAPIQVVQPAKVVWTSISDGGRAWRVGVEFLD
jgi:hypothetical protein